MKRTLAILLTLVLMMSVLPMGLFTITASAATSGYYTYTVSNGEATITDVSTSISGAVTIPSTLGGYPVTSIGDDAFWDCSSLTSITIPDSVTSIGDGVFYGCESLTSITIPDSVTSIGDNAFWDCSSLTSITIPDSVTSIGEHAFGSCGSLTSITIPDSVTSIGYYAFSWCTSLISIIIPDSVTSIGEYAVYYCSALKTVYYGGTKDQWNAIEIYNDYNGNDPLLNAEIIYNADLLTYEISNGEVTITGCDTSITGTLTIPSTIEGYPVTSIGSNAFRDCTSLTTITIPDSVTSIGNWAFEYCTSLTSITIPDSVTSIGSSAFFYCESLTSIIIGDSVTSISLGAFSGCSSLESITVDKNNKVYHSDGNCLIETSSKTLIAGCNDSVIPSDGSVTSIGSSAFRGCTSLTSITIPDSVTSIGEWAFYNCSSLTSITIPDSVMSIGNYAFEYCKSLTSITIPDGVTSIGEWAFYECTSLTSITIPDSVTSIGEWAFWRCSSLTSITIPDSVTSIGDNAFYACESLTAITIPDSVTSIGDNAFYACESLTAITIPDSVTSIGDGAFSRCSSFESITVDKNNKVYHSDGNCLIETSSKTLIAGCKNSDIPSDGSVTSIGDYVFYNCRSLTSITIPDSVTSIGDRAFSYCSSLKTVYYGGTKAKWDAISIGGSNNQLLNAELKCALGMVKEGSIRHEGVDENGNYQSAGIRFKSRVSSDFRKSASELGFVAVPTALLGNMTIAEYVAQPDNQALTAKVKGNGMKEVIYAVSTDENGQKYYDYQMMIKGLTCENVANNLLDTEISVAMYAIIDGETIYTETMSYSYNWFVAQTTK